MFGSSKNGFGFRDSDLDICMTLEGHENAEVRVLKLVKFTIWNSRLLDVFHAVGDSVYGAGGILLVAHRLVLFKLKQDIIYFSSDTL